MKGPNEKRNTSCGDADVREERSQQISDRVLVGASSLSLSVLVSRPVFVRESLMSAFQLVPYMLPGRNYLRCPIRLAQLPLREPIQSRKEEQSSCTALS